MPKITTVNKQIAGSYYKVEIWYNSQNLFFIKAGLPEDMVTHSNAYQRLTSITSEKSLESVLGTLINEYNKAVTVKTKMIYINASLSTWLGQELNLPSSHPLYSHWFSNDKKNFGFDIEYRVVEQRTVDGKKSYFDLKGNRYHHMNERDLLIEHTEDREQFFKRIVEAITKIGANMAEFFVKDPLLLADKIDNGQKLLG